MNVRFGSESRNPLSHLTKNPGPGSYDHTSMLSKTSTSLKFRHKPLSKTTNSPGPGNYTARSGLNPNGYSIGKNNRFNHKVVSDTPGPGNYEVNNVTVNSPKYAVGKGNRSNLGSQNPNMPGPGQYE